MDTGDRQTLDHRGVLDQLADAVVAADADGRIVYVNAAAEALLGWGAGQLVGRSLAVIQPQRLRPAHLAALRHHLATRGRRVPGDAMRVAVLRRDGTEVDIELKLASVRPGSGDELLVASLRSVGDVVELERRLAVTGQLRAVAGVAARLGSHLDPDEVAGMVADTLVEEFQVAAVEVWLADAGGDLRLAAGRTAPAEGDHVDEARVPRIGHQELHRAWDELRQDGAGSFGGGGPGRGAPGVGVVPVRSAQRIEGLIVHASRTPPSPELLDVLDTFAALVGSRLAEASILSREEHARAETEAALRRASFLDRAGRVLASSLDYEVTLAALARLAVPTVSDWCGVDVVDDDGSLRRLGVAHTDRTKEELVIDISRRYPPRPGASFGPAKVVRTGRPQLVAEITDDMLVAVAPDATALDLLRRLGFRSYLCVPLKARGRTLGAITLVAAESGRRFGPADVALVEGLARSAALAIDNARLFRDLNVAHEANADALAELNSLFSDAPVGRAFLDRDLRYVRVNRAFVAMTGLPAEVLSGATATESLGAVGERLDVLQRQVLETGVPVVGAEVSGESPADPGQIHHWTVNYQPVLAAGGQVLGIGALLIDVTEHKRADEALKVEQAFLAAVLQNLTDAVVGCDANGTFTLFNQAARELHGFGAQAVAPEHWAERYNLLLPDGTPMSPDQVPLRRALAGEEVRDVEMVIASRDADPRVVLCNGQALRDEAGRKIGAVVAMHDVTHRQQAEARLSRQALHDPLTGLPNRLLLLDRLRLAMARTERHATSVAALFLDLDHFKVINDSLGHEAGDQVLVAVADRLRRVMRPSDTVARLGGDEFVVLCEELASAADALALTQRIQSAVAAPGIQVEGTDVSVTTSVGVAVARGTERPEDLLRNADTAMYRAKRRGRAGHELFDDTMRAQAVERLSVENALRSAVEQGRLRLLYQPIIDLRTGRMVSTEALVRYHDPDRGLVGPAEFLDIAEDSGLIQPIGRWVLAEACRQTGTWQHIDGAEGFGISVNLSARQLADPRLAEDLEASLAAAELSSSALALEITETVLMEAAGSTLRILERLKGTQRHLGIDDFGTGYSSLTYLRRFPVDFVKIDRSFVSGLGVNAEDTAIVTAVVGLGKALGLTTVAEGVETEGQLQLLRDLGCDCAQGYHFARPQPADAINDLLVADRRW